MSYLLRTYDLLILFAYSINSYISFIPLVASVVSRSSRFSAINWTVYRLFLLPCTVHAVYTS